MLTSYFREIYCLVFLSKRQIILLLVRSLSQTTIRSFITCCKVIECSKTPVVKSQLINGIRPFKERFDEEKISLLISSCSRKCSFLSVTNLCLVDFPDYLFPRLRKQFVDFSISSYHWHLLLIFTPSAILS